MARRSKADAEATREAILDAAEGLFLERGVSATTLEQIARRAGVTRGAIYWHFSSKPDLLVAMRQRVDEPMWAWIDQRRQELSDDPMKLMREACSRVLERIRADRTYRNVHAIFLTRCELGDEHRADMDVVAELDERKFAAIVADFERAHALGLLRPDISPRTATLMLFSLVQGMIGGWLRAPARFDIRDEGEAMLSVFFDSIARRDAGIEAER